MNVRVTREFDFPNLTSDNALEFALFFGITYQLNSAEPSPSRTSWIRSGWITVLVIALAAAVAQAFGRFSYGVLLPAIRDDMGITNTLAGFIGAANVGAYLIGTLMVAWNSWGRRKVPE